MADWSSLPGDVVNRIADCLLATDDLDYYVDLRAVCHGWRTSTADPKNDSARFRPRQWVMLEEVQGDARLFVNPATGRFVRKDLPVLRRYDLIAGAVGRLLVLAERSSPRAVRLLNPFTGSLTRFTAAVPASCISVVVAHVNGTSAPTLVLFCDFYPGTIHWADPDSESFSSYQDKIISNHRLPLLSELLVGGIYAAACEHGTVSSSLLPSEACKILTSLVMEQFTDYFSKLEEETESRCFLVESAGEILVVFNLTHGIEVFKIGDNMVIQPVKSIGNRALFVGDYRCLSVDADKFASVDASSVYCCDASFNHFHVYSLNGTKRCAGRPISLIHFTDFPPLGVAQLLCFYTCKVALGSAHGWERAFCKIDD